jgi:hypothetical protein
LNSKKLLLKCVTWVLFIGLIVCVGWRGWDLLNREKIEWTKFNFGWLALSFVCYSLGLIPQAWYWFRLMKKVGMRLPWQRAIQAHITGHLGKYVPGKATVVLIRSGWIRQYGVPLTISAWAAIVETLMFIALGALIGIMSLPFLLADSSAEKLTTWFGTSGYQLLQQILPYQLYVLGGILVLMVACVPMITPLLDWTAQLLTRKKTASEPIVPEELSTPDSSTEPATAVMSAELATEELTKKRHVSNKLVWEGIGLELLSWILQGGSLVLVMMAWGIDPPSLSAAILWASIGAVATAIGFVAFFAPGGIGVKESIIIELLLLQPHISPSDAVAIALAHRLVSLSSELLSSGLWYVGLRFFSQSNTLPSNQAH